MNTLAQTLGGITVAVIAFAAIVLAVMWTIFPFVVYSQLGQIIRLLKSIQLGVTSPTPQPSLPQPLDFTVCRCVHCSQEVSFNRHDFQAGATTVCPKCGMETQLYIPPALAGMQR